MKQLQVFSYKDSSFCFCLVQVELIICSNFIVVSCFIIVLFSLRVIYSIILNCAQLEHGLNVQYNLSSFSYG